MKHVYTILIFLLLLVIESQAQVDSVLTEIWSSNSWQFDRLERYEYIVSNDERLKSARYHYNWEYNWSSYAWENSYKYSFSYDSDDRLFKEHMSTYENNDWSPQQLRTFFYNEIGLDSQTLVTNQQTGQYWSRQTKSYDENNHLTAQLSENWDASNNAWNNTILIDFETDENGVVIEQIIRSWSPGDSIWNPTSRYTFTDHGPEAIDTATGHYWSSGNWIASTRTFTYRNSEGYIFKTASEHFDGGNGWVKQGQEHHSIYPNGLTDNILYQFFNASTQVYDNTKLVTFIYLAPLSVSDLTPTPRASVYPNPNFGTFTLTTSPRQRGANFQITDVQGNLVKEGKVQSDLEMIDASTLGAGMYFIQVQGHGLEVLPFVIR